MRILFFLILVFYLLAQTPLGKKYVSRYYKKAKVYVQKLLQTDSLPIIKKSSPYNNKTTQYLRPRKATESHPYPTQNTTTQYSRQKKSEESQEKFIDSVTDFGFSDKGSSSVSGGYSHY